jgi:hypothetical protein
VSLTNHKKSVRALAIHPHEFTMASASADNIKKWKFPRGERQPPWLVARAASPSPSRDFVYLPPRAIPESWPRTVPLQSQASSS